MIYGCLASLFLNKIKIVTSVSGLGYVFSDKKIISKILRLFIIFIYKIIFLKKNIKVIFQNTYDKNYFKKKLNLRDNQVFLIPGSGVNVSTYEFRPIPKEETIVLFAGRLIYSKGLEEFVKASNIVQNAKFVLAGKIDYESNDSVSIEKINYWTENFNVEYWGFSKNIKEIIYKSSVVVLPSYYGEGLPKILIEASACGRPIVTTYNPGCREAIQEFKTGLAVPIKDYISLASAIDFLLNNPSVMKQMSIKSRELAEKRYNIEYVVNKHIEIYNHS